MKRVKHDIPNLIADEIVEGTLGSHGFTFRQGMIITRPLVEAMFDVWGDDIKFEVFEKRIKVTLHTPYPADSMADFEVKIHTNDPTNVSTSVQNEIPKKDQAKWMMLISHIAKCVTLKSKPPICVSVSSKPRAKAETLSLHGFELNMLCQLRHTDNYSVFAHDDVIIIIVDIK